MPHYYIRDDNCGSVPLVTVCIPCGTGCLPQGIWRQQHKLKRRGHQLFYLLRCTTCQRHGDVEQQHCNMTSHDGQRLRDTCHCRSGSVQAASCRQSRSKGGPEARCAARSVRGETAVGSCRGSPCHSATAASTASSTSAVVCHTAAVRMPEPDFHGCQRSMRQAVRPSRTPPALSASAASQARQAAAWSTWSNLAQ
jgi:hypothetical protein